MELFDLWAKLMWEGALDFGNVLRGRGLRLTVPFWIYTLTWLLMLLVCVAFAALVE